MNEIVDIAFYTVPVFILLIAIEIFALSRERNEEKMKHKGYSWRDSATSVSIYGIGRVVNPLGGRFIALPIVLIFSMLTPMHLSPSSPWVWVLAIVGVDLSYYWQHRLQHRVRFLWAAHSVHHSSQHFNMTTAIRLSWLIPGSFLVAVVDIPLALIGIPAWMIFLSHTIVLLFQFPIHTEKIGKLPDFIEFIFNTPSHHRVHHGVNNPYLDKNYAGILIVWDRLFGTYAHEIEPVRYGLTRNIDTHNPIKANYHEFVAMVRDVRKARSWRGRVAYILGPPGFSETQSEVAADAHIRGSDKVLQDS
ncbi:hypothetical protein GOEFS_115_00840 [Gordonia effusa NBRC 100432]|uniref:Fatty acid hydroxylase domain-containing protein n=1 Tax=Gordonia effusa NBRC 100432 TaxID=1077974 RepID=H0R5U3_9ACTN|nr:sterol desaturase family protein [Gordonia effusa]GAB20444.1 hypothetical protein GOEFS_115_00840 [Gordonia effusa NBRC 100432]